MRAAADNGEPRPPVSPSPAELGRTRPRRRGQARSSGGLALRSRPPSRVADPSGPGSARGRTPPPPPHPEGERASVAPVPPNLVRGSAGVRQPLPAPLQSVGSGPAPAPARPAPGTTGTRAVRTCCVTSATLRISGVWMVWDGKTVETTLGTLAPRVSATPEESLFPLSFLIPCFHLLLALA